MMQRRKLEELNLLDDFLFGSMVTHPEVGERFVRELLRIIFNREFGSLKVIPQKVYPGRDTDKHGVRLDVYLEEETDIWEEVPEEKEEQEGKAKQDGPEQGIRAKYANIYDIEPDKNGGRAGVAALPKRVRFYHGIIDAQLLRSGLDYSCLKHVTVIMIVPYDPFGFDRMVYTIARGCRELPDMPYDDGSKTLYLYTKGREGNPPKRLQELLRYMEKTSRETAVYEELRRIQRMVETVKTDEGVSIEYMKSFERDQMMRAEGKKEGREEGRKEGIEEGRREEKKNTERERQRADAAEEQIKRLQEELARVKQTL